MRTKKMPQDSLTFLQRIQEYGLFGYIWIALIALFGGTVRYVESVRKGEKPGLMRWISELIISGFVGLITALICKYYQLDPYLTYAIVGMAAHKGTTSLYFIENILKKNLKTEDK